MTNPIQCTPRHNTFACPNQFALSSPASFQQWHAVASRDVVLPITAGTCPVSCAIFYLECSVHNSSSEFVCDDGQTLIFRVWRTAGSQAEKGRAADS